MKWIQMNMQKEQTIDRMEPHISGSSRQKALELHEEATSEEQGNMPMRSVWWGRWLFYTGVLACVLTLLGAALYHIWSQAQAVQMGYTYSDSMKKYKILKAENNQLRLLVNQLLSSHRLAQIGRRELGMQRQHASQMISESQVRQMFGAALRGRGVRLARAKGQSGFTH